MSILATRYGVARPRAITAMLQRLQTALPAVPVIEDAPVVEVSTTSQVETLAPWVVLFPRQREEHLKAQRRFYATIKAADLPLSQSQRLSGVNTLLGTSFTSSTQLSPTELHACADAIEAGRFAADWTLQDAPADDAPLPDAPPESEPETDTGTTPAAPEFLDEMAMNYDLAVMRAADRARSLNALRSERVLLETRLIELDRAILCA